MGMGMGGMGMGGMPMGGGQQMGKPKTIHAQTHASLAHPPRIGHLFVQRILSRPGSPVNLALLAPGAMGGYGFQNPGMMGQMGGGQMGGLPPNFKEGDWMCPKCNAHNYAVRACLDLLCVWPLYACSVRVSIKCVCTMPSDEDSLLQVR